MGDAVSPEGSATVQYAFVPSYASWPVIGHVLLKVAAWNNLRKPWLKRPSEDCIKAEMNFRWIVNRQQFAEQMGVSREQADEKFRELMMEAYDEATTKMLLNHRVANWNTAAETVRMP